MQDQLNDSSININIWQKRSIAATLFLSLLTLVLLGLSTCWQIKSVRLQKAQSSQTDIKDLQEKVRNISTYLKVVNHSIQTLTDSLSSKK